MQNAKVRLAIFKRAEAGLTVLMRKLNKDLRISRCLPCDTYLFACRNRISMLTINLFINSKCLIAVVALRFRTDRPEQTV